MVIPCCSNRDKWAWESYVKKQALKLQMKMELQKYIGYSSFMYLIDRHRRC